MVLGNLNDYFSIKYNLFTKIYGRARTSDFDSARHETKKSKTCRCGQSYRRENENCSRGAEKGIIAQAKQADPVADPPAPPA